MLTQSSEGVDFRSFYRLVPAIQLGVSSAIKQQTLFSGPDSDPFAETRYGGGFTWSPSELYSVAFVEGSSGLIISTRLELDRS